jgi:hypothetical protein
LLGTNVCALHIGAELFAGGITPLRFANAAETLLYRFQIRRRIFNALL